MKTRTRLGALPSIGSPLHPLTIIHYPLNEGPRLIRDWVAHGAAARKEQNVPVPLKVRDLLEFATVRGAENAALQKKIGTLTPGKEADIVIIRAEDINTMPLTNAVGIIVSYANAGNVDSVFIAGNVRTRAPS